MGQGTGPGGRLLAPCSGRFTTDGAKQGSALRALGFAQAFGFEVKIDV